MDALNHPGPWWSDMTIQTEGTMTIYNGYRRIFEALLGRKSVLVMVGTIIAAGIYGILNTLYEMTGGRYHRGLGVSIILAILSVVIISGRLKIALLQRDITTGLYRRLYIEELLTRLEGGGTDVTIGIVDINGLREVNNTQGHRAGDQLLRLTAKRLFNVIGKQRRRWVGRLGGDEFVVVATGKVDCVDLSGEIEEALHAKHPLNNTWGLGVAGVARCRRGDTRSALECADMALLRAKRHFYDTRQTAVYQYNAQLDGIPKVEHRPVRRLREAMK